MGLRLESPSTASSVRVSSETITTGISSRLASFLRRGLIASDTDQVRVNENPDSSSEMNPSHADEVFRQLISSYNAKKDPSLTLTEKSLLQAKAIYNALIMNPKERGEAGIRVIVLGDFTKTKKVQTQYPISRYSVYVLFHNIQDMREDPTDARPIFVSTSNSRLQDVMPEGESADLLVNYQADAIRYETDL